MSVKSSELSARINQQDALYVAAVVEDAPPRLLARIRAVRNDLCREWGQQILKDQWAAAEKVGA